MAKSSREWLYVFVILVLVAVIVVIFASTTITTSTQEAAVSKVKAVYETLTENSVEIISVKEESGMYRIRMATTLQNGQQGITEVLASKDGLLLTDRVINTTGYTEQLAREKAFAECLLGKVAIVGLSNDANTITQLQTIGNYAYKVYVDCSGANLAVCQQANITQVPTIVAADQRFPGPQPLSFFTQNFNCSL